MKSNKLIRKEKRISLVPFVQDLLHYKFRFFKRDFFSAISIALLSIPQSIAYSLLAGLPPIAGIFSSIFGTIFTASLGSSRYLVACPSTGVAILIQTIMAQILETHFPGVTGVAKEALTMQILTLIVLIMGVIQFVSSFLNLGKLLQFISRSVVLGYLLGVAIAIFVSQTYYVFGISKFSVEGPVVNKLIHLVTHIPQLNLAALLLSLAAAIFLIFLKRKFRKLPNSFIMLVVISVIAYFVNAWLQMNGNTLFSHVNDLGDLGFSQRPQMIFKLPPMNFPLMSQIFFSALAIALLTMLEVFSISRSLAMKSGDEVYSNQEFYAVGFANIFLSTLQWAMPVSGSLARSFLNYENRAKTRFAAVMSGFLVAILIYIGWPLVQHVPLVALAALLIVVVFSLQDWKEIKLCFFATRGDAVVFLLTVLSCLLFRLDIAFYIGIILSIASFLRKAANFHLVEYAFDSKGRLTSVTPSKKMQHEIRIIGIGGEMFFAAVDLFQSALQAIAEQPYVKVVILRLNGVYHMDASMCLAILGLYEFLAVKKRKLLISGVGAEVLYVFKKAGVIKKIGANNLFVSDETKPQLSTWKACQRAMQLIDKR